MRLIMPVVGAGDSGDARRVNLPTYTLLAFSPDGMFAAVDVPDDCLPPALVISGGLRQINGISAPDLTRATQAQLRRLYDFLDGRYAEHAGRFRLR